jgi:uncharacterized protein (TIGR03083 family)
MPPSFPDRCRLLDEAWQWWGTTLSLLDTAAWSRRTRLEGWDVAALAAHHSLLVQGLGFLAAQPVHEAAEIQTARGMLRRFNEPSGLASTAASAVAEMARQQAATSTAEELVAVFVTAAPAVVASMRDTGPIVVDYFGNGTFPIGEAMSIAAMEAVVHGLDLRDAIGGICDPPPDAPTQFAVELLASVADPVVFIESATGRTERPPLPVIR